MENEILDYTYTRVYPLADTSAWKCEIDLRLCCLYGLSYNDMLYVSGKTSVHWIEAEIQTKKLLEQMPEGR